MMPWKMHWKCRATIMCAYPCTHTYVRCVTEHVCKCACVYISKPKYLHTHCTVMKHQRLLLALQSVPLLSMPCPTSACSSLSDCPAWNAALPTLAMMNCSRKHPPCPCYDQVSEFGGLFACSRCLLCQIWPQECEASGLSLVKQRRTAFSLKFAPSIISRSKAEKWFLPGRSQPKRNYAFKEVGLRECQWSLSLISSLQAGWGADRICRLNLISSKDRSKIIIVTFWQSKMFLFAGKSLTHVQPCCPLRMSKKEALQVKCCLPHQPILPQWWSAPAPEVTFCAQLSSTGIVLSGCAVKWLWRCYRHRAVLLYFKWS